MRDNEPTIPNLRQPDGHDQNGAPAPIWPAGGGRTGHPAGGMRPTTRTLLGVSLGANAVLLVGLLGMLLLAHAGAFAPGTQGSVTPGTALGSPSTTATSSPASSAGWLTVAPASVSLGCSGGQETQMVVLTNTGPQAVQWQAEIVASTGQAGIEVDPNEGELAAGANLTIKIHNTTHAGGGHGAAGQRGVIRFTPQTPNAGTPPSLNYTTVSCH